eukprot:CAMPEP_0181359766 /NCGR_PEP_ID=MMETSP1106-20121128/6275_1 /TAXON_ID=81844 /ORGANISM="Mantoniella antarctica, Strain SL-175" /LENGTH=465 /DNA_ID=CAMNT_0023472929 /DNA_START=123 /DNA_END=1517 /DNA_ORIENTATION=+
MACSAGAGAALPSPYDAMSPEEASARAEQGGTLLCLDVPGGTEFGVDCTIWSVGPKFQGVKMVPPGLHLSLAGGAGNDATRIAEFLWIAPSEVVVRKWDPVNEAFAPGCGMGEEEAERYKAGVARHDFDATTGPYPLESHQKWRRLSGHITEATLEGCGIPAGTRVVPGDPDAALDGKGKKHDGSDGADAAAAVVPFFPGIARAPVFSSIAQRAPRGMSPADVTRLHHDTGARLAYALGLFRGDWRALLGEVQVAFVLFLLIGSMAALEHWKSVVNMLCANAGEMHAHLELYKAFLATLTHQLECASSDFFTDEISADNFLRPALVKLVQEARPMAEQKTADTGGSGGLLVEEVTRRLKGIQRFVHRRFGVSLAEDDTGGGGTCDGATEMSDEAAGSNHLSCAEEGEDEPVVVELSEGTYMRMDFTDNGDVAAQTELVSVAGVAAAESAGDKDSAGAAASERMGW